jgi:hypothetical protein
MTKFLAGVLSVIAAGVLLIAYGLLNPRVAAFDRPGDFDRFGRPVPASEQLMLRDPSGAPYAYDRAAAPGYAVPAGYALVPYAAPQAVPQAVSPVRPVRTVVTEPVAPRRTTQYVERRSGRDWKKTAMIIGGSSAAGAGVGAIFGGKKGALIGAALGGGASTIYETTRH